MTDLENFKAILDKIGYDYEETHGGKVTTIKTWFRDEEPWWDFDAETGEALMLY